MMNKTNGRVLQAGAVYVFIEQPARHGEGKKAKRHCGFAGLKWIFFILSHEAANRNKDGY